MGHLIIIGDRFYGSISNKDIEDFSVVAYKMHLYQGSSISWQLKAWSVIHALGNNYMLIGQVS